MYKCDFCNKQTEAGEGCTKVITHTRAKSYPERVYYTGGREIIDPGGTGRETVEEKKMCPKCVSEQRMN